VDCKFYPHIFINSIAWNISKAPIEGPPFFHNDRGKKGAKKPDAQSGVPRFARDRGSFLYCAFFVAIPLFEIGVRSNHRLTFPYSKVAAKARRPDLNIIRFSAVGPDAFRTRLK